MRVAIRLGATALLAATLVVGCSKDKDKDKGKTGEKAGTTATGKTGDTKQGDKVVKKGVELAGKHIKGVNELADKAKDLKGAMGKKVGTYTVEQYEKRMLALADCTIKGRYIDRKCEAQKAFREERRKMKTPKEASALSGKHLAHASPAVRLHAAGMMNSFFGAKKESQDKVLAAFAAEKNEAVATALLNVVGSKASANPKVAALLKTALGHEFPMVRKEAISWLTTSFASKVDGSVDWVINAIKTDKDPKVRAYGCENIGKRGDEKALKILKNNTTDKAAAKDTELYVACMRGLKGMFINYPFFAHSSKKAFDLFTQRLSTQKCTDKIPPWIIMSDIGSSAMNPKQAKIAPWFEKKKGQLIKALGKVVTCKKANWMARNGAVKSLAALKADKKVFAKLLAAYKGEEKKYEHGHTVKELQKHAQ